MVRIILTPEAERRFYDLIDGLTGSSLRQWISEEREEGHSAEGLVSMLHHYPEVYFEYEMTIENQTPPYYHEKSSDMAYNAGKAHAIDGMFVGYRQVKEGDYYIDVDTMLQWWKEEQIEPTHSSDSFDRVSDYISRYD